MIDIEELDNGDKQILLELIPKKDLFDFIKNNNKFFSKELYGIRIDKKSKLLQQKLPEIILKSFLKGDMLTTKYIHIRIRELLEEFNSYVYFKLNKDKELLAYFEKNVVNSKEQSFLCVQPNFLAKDAARIKNSSYLCMQYINSIIQTKNKQYYVKLVEILLDKLDSEQIFLYFTLNEISLKVRQIQLLEKSIENALEYIKLKETIKEECREELEDKIRIIKTENETLLEQEKIINRDLINEINQKDKEIREIHQKYEQKEHQIEILNKNIEELEKKIQEFNVKYKGINEDFINEKQELQNQLEKELIEKRKLKDEILGQDKIIEKLNKELDEIYDEYNKNFELELSKKNKVLLEEESNLKDSISNLNQSIKELKIEVDNLELEKQKKIKKVNEYDEIVFNFIENIDKELINSAIKSSMLNYNVSTETRQKSTELYIKKNVKVDRNKVELFDDIDEFSDMICDNFENIGIGKIRNELSDYIVSVLASKMIPVIMGYKVREIAKAISYAYSAETPLIITLPDGYNDVDELLDIYRNNDSKVYLIEGAIGQMNETTILSFIKEVNDIDNDKILLISCDDSNMKELMPSYMYEYFSLIEINDIKPVLKYDYCYGDSVNALTEFKEQKIEIDSSYSKLKKLFKNVDFNKAYIASRTLILAYLKELSQNKALKILATCDIKSTINDDETIEKLSANIQNYKDELGLEPNNILIGE